MISLKRSTLAFMVLVTLVVGAGLGTWGAGAVDQMRPSRSVPPAVTLPAGTYSGKQRALAFCIVGASATCVTSWSPRPSGSAAGATWGLRLARS